MGNKQKETNNMDKTRLKETLLQYINRLANNEDVLQKVLNYFISLESYEGVMPSIADDSVMEYIKDDVNIIVPFVCDDMFEYNKDGDSLSLGEYICDKYMDRWHIKSETIKNIKSDFYFGLSLFEQDKRGKDFSNSLYDAIKKGIEEGDIKLRECVKDFLSKGVFPVIVTTFGFPLIEAALSDIGYESEWYNPNQRNDLPFIKNESTRVVYHVFGGETSSTWVYNEQTLLKYVHALHSEDFCAKNLANYLRGTGNESVKRPLILGSTLPDWLFRFFVYPLYGEKFSESNGYWMSLDDIEKGLDLFLNRNKYTGQTNLRNGNRMDELLSEATVERIAVNQKEQKPYKIFVSYKREEPSSANSEKIERIYELLRKQAKATGGDIWRDVYQVADGGNPYWANIKKAIKECNLFIPLVSLPYLNEFCEAPDITKYAEKPIPDAEQDKANDDKSIMALRPVVREAFYAIAYGKKCAPVVIANQEGSLTGGTTESIIKDSNDGRNLPSCIFLEHTNLVHYDKDPKFFTLPKID